MKNRKKIGILTYFFADNYGALLQCYSLKKYIQSVSNEYEVETVGYVPSKMISLKSKIRRMLKLSKKEKFFKEFRRKNLNVTKRKTFNVVVVGSDQVWNPEINGYDSKWVKPSLKYDTIISYAASTGKNNFDEKGMEYFKDNVKEMQSYFSISVREKESVKFFEKLNIYPKYVCDPVLLNYNSKCFDDISKRPEGLSEHDYIFVFSLEKNIKIDEFTDRLKNENNLIVVSCHPNNVSIQKNDIFVKDCSVENFLYLIRNAKVVVTNSYHCLIFGNIFEKKTYSFYHSSLSLRQKNVEEIFKVLKKTSDYAQYEGGCITSDGMKIIEDSKRYLIEALEKNE